MRVNAAMRTRALHSVGDATTDRQAGSMCVVVAVADKMVVSRELMWLIRNTKKNYVSMQFYKMCTRARQGNLADLV